MEQLMQYIEECTLLSKDQLIGPNHLSIFDIIVLKWKTTNFAESKYRFRFTDKNTNYVLKDIHIERKQNGLLK